MKTPDSSENQVQDGTAADDKNVQADSAPEAIGDDQNVQPEGQADNTGKEKLGNEGNLPPELEEVKKGLLKDWHEKNQKLADEKRMFESQKKQSEKDSTMLRNLFGQEWFKKAMAAEKDKREGGVDDISLTDEQFQSMSQNRESFDKYVTAKARAVAQSMYGGPLSEQAGVLKEIKLREEFKTAADKFKDFKELNDAGRLDKYLEDDRLTYEEAYRLYKSDHSTENEQERIQQEAERILSARKAGSVEKNGTPSPKGSRVVVVKDEDDAFNQAWAEISQGHDVQLTKKI